MLQEKKLSHSILVESKQISNCNCKNYQFAKICSFNFKEDMANLFGKEFDTWKLNNTQNISHIQFKINVVREVCSNLFPQNQLKFLVRRLHV